MIEAIAVFVFLAIGALSAYLEGESGDNSWCGWA